MNSFVIKSLTLLLLYNKTLGQNTKAYLDSNITLLEKTTLSKNSNELNFDKYQAYFFGENHRSLQAPYKENLLIDLIGTLNIFVEAPINYYYPIQEFMTFPVEDTTTKDFELFSGNKATECLLRNLYQKNLKKNSAEYKIFPIDIVYEDAININDLLWFYKKNYKPKSIKRTFNYLIQIKKDSTKFKNLDSLLTQYKLFRNSFYFNLSSHKRYFKQNFNEIKIYIDGIYAYIVARSEDSLYGGFVSNTREEFMLNNLKNRIIEYKIKNFICINGSLHVSLADKNQWSEFNIESLAHRFKRECPDINVCSIYFMDKAEDDLGVYFPEEKQLILENTEPGKTYLIRLDGENTPFKKLSESFQYIVVW